MEKNLAGRVALVSGATRGIGKTIAMSLASRGASLFICARNWKELEKTGQEIWIETGNHPFIVSCNICEDGVIESIFEMWPLNGLDILINNVGGPMKTGNFFELTDDDWKKVIDLNLMSMVRFCRLAVPLLKKSQYARIINISSLVAHQPGKLNPHYGVAKASMLYLSKYLANELAPFQITVNAICPGILKCGGWEDNVRDRAERDHVTTEKAETLMESEAKAKIPLGFVGSCKDVANYALYLASDEARFITGTVTDIDGGMRRSVK